MKKNISIVNQKGGVGKTTTAVNLSASLALLNSRVLLIDLDPQGNASSGCGINPNELDKSIYNVLVDQEKLSDIIINTEIDGLSVAPANNNLIGANVELANIEKRDFILKNAIEEVKYRFDYVLIDCPPSLGYLTLNALVSSDSVLIPLQCEYYAMEGLAQLINTFNLVKEQLNEKIYIEGILLTMHEDTSLSKEVTIEITEHFKDKVFKTIIPRNNKLSEAPGFGKPAALYDITSIGATKYVELAKELSEK